MPLPAVAENLCADFESGATMNMGHYLPLVSRRVRFHQRRENEQLPLKGEQARADLLPQHLKFGHQISGWASRQWRRGSELLLLLSTSKLAFDGLANKLRHLSITNLRFDPADRLHR